MDMDKKIIVSLFLLALLLAGCQNRDSATTAPTLDATALNQTAVSQATLNAEGTQNAPTAPVTPAPTETWTPVPTLDRTRPSNSTPTAEIPCNQAAAGRPIDVTIPDGTVLAPGEPFSKTWRLKNVGSCEWTRLYTVTFFSGNSLDAIQTQYLAQEVSPGQTIDLTVDMEAPLEPGIYQSNWMFSDASGALFGIGPNGDAPFWVRIEVVQDVTDTPTPTPTITPTPVVYLTGNAELAHEDQLDLDSGTLNPGDATQADLVYQSGGDPAHVLMTMNGTQWAVAGESEPGFGDCNDAALSGNALSFADVPTGTYLCYRTSDALSGWLQIGEFTGGSLSVQFLTWALP